MTVKKASFTDGGNTGNAGAISSATVNKAPFTDGGNTGREAVPPGTNAETVSGAATARPRIALICAMARNRVIGCGNALPWRLPADLKHFRELTTGHALLMGRKTFESLGRPLPNRTNIVVTRQRDYAPVGALIAHSLDAGLALAAQHVSPASPEVFVIGGENLYAQMLPRADRLYITQIDAEVEGDAWFPLFDPEAWHERERHAQPVDDKNPYACVFTVLERKTPRL